MGAKTGIAWARSTFNPWIGCTRVSPGCDHCYAEALDARHRYGGATHWGAGVARHRTSSAYWQAPLKWDRIAALEKETGSCVDGSGRLGRSAMGIRNGWTRPGFWPVFPSLCDPFDNEVPDAWRLDFFTLIADTPHLTWLLLTKRIGNVIKMLPYRWRVDHIPFDNVWIGASIVNQEEADRDIPKLLAVPAAKRFISYEPALEPVDFAAWLYPDRARLIGDRGPVIVKGQPVIDQIIVGGESDQWDFVNKVWKKARPFNVEWAYDTIRQCRAAGVAVFVKQLGSECFETRESREWFQGHRDRAGEAGYKNVRRLKDRAGADPAEWPEDLRVQEFPQ
jgi:protein gp37